VGRSCGIGTVRLVVRGDTPDLVEAATGPSFTRQTPHLQLPGGCFHSAGIKRQADGMLPVRVAGGPVPSIAAAAAAAAAADVDWAGKLREFGYGV